MISDRDIKDVVNAFVDIANSTGVLTSVASQYDTGGRSLGIRIVGNSKFKTGIIIEDNTIKSMRMMDEPTVTATIEKITFWNIINAPTAEVARTAIYTSMYTEQTIDLDPPIGKGAELHFENIIKIFNAVANEVIN